MSDAYTITDNEYTTEDGYELCGPKCILCGRILGYHYPVSYTHLDVYKRQTQAS